MSFTLSREAGETGPVQWLVENRVLQFKYNLVFGRGEAGKSSLLAKLIGDWHTNTEMKGDRKLKRILWITEEEGLTGKVKPRLFQYGIEDDQVLTIDFHSGKSARPILPNDQDKFVKLLKDNSINCIVMDPWVEFFPSDWTVINHEHVRPYINCLNRVCLQARSTIFGIGHIRKSTGSHSSDDMLGCRQVIDSTRCVNRVDKTEDSKPCHFFTVQKCNDAEPTMPLQFGFEPKVNGFSKVKWMGEKDMTIADIKAMTESKVKRGKMDQAIRLLSEALATQEVSAKDLIEEAKNYGIGDRTLDEAKAQLNIRSERRIYSDSGKAYWVWMMPKESQSNIQDSGESAMPQLTFTDLPEYAEQPLKTLADYPPPFQYEGPTEAEIQASYDEVEKAIADEMTAIAEGSTKKPATKKPAIKKPSAKKPAIKKPSAKKRQASA